MSGQNDRVGQWVADRIGRVSPWGGFSALGLEDEESGNLVAGVVLTEYNGVNAQVHVAGEGHYFANRKTIFAVLDWWFNQLQLKRVTGFVAATNEAALRFDKALGFREEFVMKDADPTGDIVVMVLRRDECLWAKKLGV